MILQYYIAGTPMNINNKCIDIISTMDEIESGPILTWRVCVLLSLCYSTPQATALGPSSSWSAALQSMLQSQLLTQALGEESDEHDRELLNEIQDKRILPKRM